MIQDDLIVFFANSRELVNQKNIMRGGSWVAPPYPDAEVHSLKGGLHGRYATYTPCQAYEDFVFLLGMMRSRACRTSDSVAMTADY